jgi:hypothetical protein
MRFAFPMIRAAVLMRYSAVAVVVRGDTRAGVRHASMV